MAVCGRQEARHGIVVAKNMQAKGCGVKNVETIWQARQKCPDLLVAAPHPELYLRYSGLTRAIMNRYSDRVEPFGIDEAWLDVTRCPLARQAGGPAVADDLRRRIQEELGLPASATTRSLPNWPPTCASRTPPRSSPRPTTAPRSFPCRWRIYSMWVQPPGA